MLAQLGLPYRNPGDDVREWERGQRGTSLLLTAGHALGPDETWHKVGLPYGPRARLVLIHLSTLAVKNQNPEIKLGKSLTNFANMLGVGNGGRNVRDLRDQIIRLSGTTMSLGLHSPAVGDILPASTKVNRTALFEELKLTWPEVAGKYVPWPKTVTLSSAFYNDLAAHAVPLDPRALSALKHSSRAIDIYTWLAYRLRHAPETGVAVSWHQVRAQFGDPSQQMKSFKQRFVQAFTQVQMVYPKARVKADPIVGLILRLSPPPSDGHRRMSAIV